MQYVKNLETSTNYFSVIQVWPNEALCFIQMCKSDQKKVQTAPFDPYKTVNVMYLLCFHCSIILFNNEIFLLHRLSTSTAETSITGKNVVFIINSNRVKKILNWYKEILILIKYKFDSNKWVFFYTTNISESWPMIHYNQYYIIIIRFLINNSM